MKNKTTKFFVLLTLMFISRAYDIFTTWLYIPDLRKETNIIVRSFHMDIMSSIIFQFVMLCVVTYFLYVYCFKEVVVQRDWRQLLFNTSNQKASLYMMGYIIPKSLIVIGFIVGTSTSFLILSTSYRDVYKHGGSTVLYGVCVVTVVFFTVRFFRDKR